MFSGLLGRSVHPSLAQESLGHLRSIKSLVFHCFLRSRQPQLASKIGLEAVLSQLEANLSQLDANLRQLEANLTRLEASWNQHEANLSQLEANLSQLEAI